MVGTGRLLPAAAPAQTLLSATLSGAGDAAQSAAGCTSTHAGALHTPKALHLPAWSAAYPVGTRPQPSVLAQVLDLDETLVHCSTENLPGAPAPARRGARTGAAQAAQRTRIMACLEIPGTPATREHGYVLPCNAHSSSACRPQGTTSCFLSSSIRWSTRYPRPPMQHSARLRHRHSGLANGRVAVSEPCTQVYVRRRPFLEKFLQEVSKHFEVVVRPLGAPHFRAACTQSSVASLFLCSSPHKSSRALLWWRGILPPPVRRKPRDALGRAGTLAPPTPF